MNIYEKMIEAKVQIAEMGLKKTGYNKYSNIHYYELADILYPILTTCKSLKMATIISYSNEYAEMQIINIEKPDEIIIITSPLSSADLKGCHPIQNIGAVETYQRRYLYMTAFDIVESDILDNTFDKNDDKSYTNNKIDNATKELDNAIGDNKDEIEYNCNRFIQMFGNKIINADDLEDFEKMRDRNVTSEEINIIIPKFLKKYK